MLGGWGGEGDTHPTVTSAGGPEAVRSLQHPVKNQPLDPEALRRQGSLWVWLGGELFCSQAPRRGPGQLGVPEGKPPVAGLGCWAQRLEAGDRGAFFLSESLIEASNWCCFTVPSLNPRTFLPHAQVHLVG